MTSLISHVLVCSFSQQEQYCLLSLLEELKENKNTELHANNAFPTLFIPRGSLPGMDTGHANSLEQLHFAVNLLLFESHTFCVVFVCGKSYRATATQSKVAF